MSSIGSPVILERTLNNIIEPGKCVLIKIPDNASSIPNKYNSLNSCSLGKYELELIEFTKATCLYIHGSRYNAEGEVNVIMRFIKILKRRRMLIIFIKCVSFNFK